MIYNIANHKVAIEADPDVMSWKRLQSRYVPFLCDGDDNLICRIKIARFEGLDMNGWTMLRDIKPDDKEMLHIVIFRNAAGDSLFSFSENLSAEPGCFMQIDATVSEISIAISEHDAPLAATAMLTSAIMLSYALSAMRYSTFIFHSSVVVNDGAGYMFIAPSGTGKSTQSRMWLDNIPGSKLLNDDNPVVRLEADSSARVYGSPWSGKTDCYIAESAPIGAIVRIIQAPENSIKRLGTLDSFMSLYPTISALRLDFGGGDNRHADLERLATTVPCYNLQCRPDPESAKICAQTVKTEKQKSK